MTNFESTHFQKLNFQPEQIAQYLKSALRDLEIAEKSKMAEVRFKFSYDALIKMGIAMIARQGYKVRSRSGHHVKILEKFRELLQDENIVIMGNKMRQDRNRDFYEGAVVITDKETMEYLSFVKEIYAKIKA